VIPTAFLPRLVTLPAGIPPSLQPVWRQYALASLVFVLVSILNYSLKNVFGYQAIALIYLLSIVLLALFVNRGAILFGTALSAIGWNYVFVKTPFAFTFSDPYDNMMLLTYFVVTLIVGQLTTRLRAQRDAEITAKLLAESERLGRTLLNSVSHEFRTPIAAISSAATTLSSTGALSAEQKNLVNEIESASTRLNHVVESLLSAARIKAGQVRPKPDWCDVADLVRVTLRRLKDQTQTHPVKTFIPPDLPLVKADFVLTEQALANLIVNAMRHTPPGTPVEITAQIKDSYLEIAVVDSGPGLPADQLGRVFDPFHRGRAAKTGGVGLGLAIVKGFIDVQGGHVKAANRNSGNGAIFTIFLNATDSPTLSQEML
jgi:two-component system sensor histidine kinase KdpD